MEGKKLLTDGTFVSKLNELIIALQARNKGEKATIVTVTALPTTGIDTSAVYLYNNEYYYYTNSAWVKIGNNTASSVPAKLLTDDSVNEKLKELIMSVKIGNLVEESGSSGSGVEVVNLLGESGTLTDEDFTKITNPTTLIKWQSESLQPYYYFRSLSFVSPKYTFARVAISGTSCTLQTIEIDQINKGWTKSSVSYSGGLTETEVDSKINTAIYGALGGSY